MLLYFDDQEDAARRLAQAAGLTATAIERHRFPDGELKLRLPATLPAHTVLYRSLDNPNEKLVELLLATRTARTLGARHLTLVAPYLAYMRQDIAFHPGEAVSQRIVGSFLADLVDAVITVDPHLHRVATLQEAVPGTAAIVLTGAQVLADLIVQRRENPLLVGPDAESAQWIALAARQHGLDHRVCTKVRSGDHAVAVTLPPGEVTGRAVVILDDMASTGHTIAAAARLLREAGAATVDAAVTHALFTPQAMALMHDSGIGEVWSTDCIAHPSNAVPMAPLLAGALARLREAQAPS
ncbi:MAG: ribose-phosphate diphosphokinase [Rhodoferax sp.]|jgi:ribose-phosphate pyrophosphokinase|nr:ribose-phosphate diphosphokinase [Rhodoferax sp.]